MNNEYKRFRGVKECKYLDSVDIYLVCVDIVDVPVSRLHSLMEIEPEPRLSLGSS